MPAIWYSKAEGLQAVEALWKAVKDLRNEFGQLILADNIFTSDEIGGFFRDGWPRRFSHMTDYADDSALLTRYRRAAAMQSSLVIRTA
jgi:hypothetical protein